MSTNAHRAITLSRQMGSGGSYIGYLVAGKLGFKFIDREVLRQAAWDLYVELITRVATQRLDPEQGDEQAATAAIAVTEPDAGSDVFAIKTKAVKKGDHYVINGSKTYITNGTQADFLTLLAKTSDAGGYHSFGLFVVPTNLPGFVVSKKLDKLGLRSSDTAELFFDNVEVPAENLIGEEGEGFIYQMKQFQHERFTILPGVHVCVQDMIDMKMSVDDGFDVRRLEVALLQCLDEQVRFMRHAGVNHPCRDCLDHGRGRGRSSRGG